MQQQEVIKQTHEMKSVEQTTCCIVGGGPAGVILALQVSELVEENGVVCGVRYHGQDGWHEIRAALTVGADGRFSRLRRLAGFEPIQTASPLDVLWFRLPMKESDARGGVGGRISAGRIIAVIDRFDYWQVGYTIPKGGYQQVRAAGLEALRQNLATGIPEFADRVDELKDWKQISVLSVESSRLAQWYRPGLLLIGDAAHVMSPVGGVGINYAIQDAVVAANVLGGKLKMGTLQTRDLAEVQRERELPTRVIQRVQTFLQGQIFARALNADPNKPFGFPPLVGVILRTPGLRAIPAQLMAFGLRHVHLKDE